MTITLYSLLENLHDLLVRTSVKKVSWKYIINMVFETLLFENSTSISFTCSPTWTSERMIFSHYLQLIYMINESFMKIWFTGL